MIGWGVGPCCVILQEEAEGSVAPRKKVMSQMLLNKFQCDQFEMSFLCVLLGRRVDSADSR